MRIMARSSMSSSAPRSGSARAFGSSRVARHRATASARCCAGEPHRRRAVNSRDLLIELFDRVPPVVHGAVDGLDQAELARAPGPGANPVGWLLWHLVRVQDHHVAQLMGQEQVWTAGEWARGFGLEPDPDNTGYGHSPDEVAKVQPRDTAVIVGYHDAVAARTRGYLEQLSAGDMDEIIDRAFQPPGTRGARLGSGAGGDLQHPRPAAHAPGGLVAPRPWSKS